MITAEHISKSFGDVQAVKDVSLVAEDGKITALLGANGAGKTTSMRMIYALITPETGVVTVDGINSTENPIAARARMGVLPDARGLYKRLTARENMAYFESELTGEKEYVFGSGGGDNLADVLKTKVLGRLPLNQPYLDEDVFAPSIYQEDHPNGKEYHLIAAKIIAQLEE